MLIKQARLRQIHRRLVPFMTIPLLLTLITGMFFQFAVVIGRTDEFLWLLELHRGKFGSINLELIYPILNAIGLLTLVITGLMMWLQTNTRKQRRV
ncbi:PepSY domain-containing protein [Leptolyngbyaceae cyanobacterium CCMR0082]|uniref:PepSY domain-containing protein n=1 Tax=Adonisia turfae CCMR0082 TaxID=2304604 RepID=A0A6M0S7J1_9CYAN|nr:PepSY domain-containing protein [Adonisia turfae]MDV3350121.1 PepSY domain-containing protein [Leptothoe sp. LEGE 181152]NEZ63941.1 PepSY domain-containing protein [Adonisia turfae CCMR0082]